MSSLALRPGVIALLCALAAASAPSWIAAQPSADEGRAEEVAVPFTREERKQAELVVILWNAYSAHHGPDYLFRAAWAYCRFCPRRVDQLEETFSGFPPRIGSMHVFATCLPAPPPPSPFIRSVLGLDR